MRAWAASLLAVALLAGAGPAHAMARTLTLTKAGESPPYRVVGQTVSASDGHSWLFRRTGPLTLLATDTTTGRSRSLDLRAAGIGDAEDCRPSAAITSMLLVSCDATGALLLRSPQFTALAVPPPAPPAAYLAQVMPHQWEDIGTQWIAGGTTTCADPRARCDAFYLNWRSGAYHLANGFDTSGRQRYDGTRQLDDPALHAVPGCERRPVGQCDQMGSYALRLQPTQAEPGRLDLLRSGHVVRTLSRHGAVGAFDLQAGRAAWVQDTRLRVRDIHGEDAAVYRLPRASPTYRPMRVTQTDGRVLVELGSTNPARPTKFYLGTIPERLRSTT